MNAERWARVLETKRRHKWRKDGIKDIDRAIELRRAGGDCPLCGEAAVAVDHCHELGLTRSLLCNQDNLDLGKLENGRPLPARCTPEWQQRAWLYVAEHAQRHARLIVAQRFSVAAR